MEGWGSREVDGGTAVGRDERGMEGGMERQRKGWRDGERDGWRDG